MKSLELPWKKIHFIGVGGVGMAGLATILSERKTTVSGSDMLSSAYTRQVEARGGTVHIGHAAANVPNDPDLVVYSAAVPADNPELEKARGNGIRCVVRGKFLAELAAAYSCVIAVAGSHGKTTTTAMIVHILEQCGLQPGYLVGGEIAGWENSAAAGAGRILVTEVDESDGTQAYMHSTYAVVVNVEDDHCWNLGGIEALEKCFKTFAGQAPNLISWASPATHRLFAAHPHVRFMTEKSIPDNLQIQIPGRHNLINCTLALTVARELGISRAKAIQASRTFAGVKRRMTKHFESIDGKAVIVEDYAHHPTELDATLETLRETWPEHRLVTVFQPHRFERVKRYAARFSALLEKADEVVVVKPFAAWLNDGSNIHPESVAESIETVPAKYWGDTPEELGLYLASTVDREGLPVLFAVIGAGDVGQAIPALKNGLTMQILDRFQSELKRVCPACVVHRMGSWGDYTTLGVGAAKPLVVEPANVLELRHALKTARDQNLRCLFVGRGSNLVGADELGQEIIIRLHGPAFTRWSRNGCFIRTGAGMAMTRLFRELAELGLIPRRAAPLAWIPGSVGGALRMNAGADTVEIGQFVDRVMGVTLDGRHWSKRGDQIDWEYRATDLPADVCLTEVLFKFGHGNRQAALKTLAESGEKRKKTQPAGRTAGCVFRNAGEAPAGRLLDTAGCKGLKVGRCRVSRKHANFIVAQNSATEEDFVTLMRLMQKRVMEHCGMVLQPEVVFANHASRKMLDANLKAPRVAVLQGGPSAEHDISLQSAAAVSQALRDAGLVVDQIDVENRTLPRLPSDTEVVFPVLHGAFGEDGGVQSLLENADLPYVGSGPHASTDIMSKNVTKQKLIEQGIATPAYQLISSPETALPDNLRFPLVVKPVSQGSTYGLTKLRSPTGWWKRALNTAFKVDSKVMAEEFVEGVEITVGVLDGEPLPVVEIVPPKGRIFDFDAKYQHKRGHTHYYCPPQSVAQRLQKKAQDIARKVYAILGARDMLRVDMIIDPHGTVWVLEANSIPGFTATSLLPMAARATGISFPELCARLVKRARGRNRGFDLKP